MTRSTHIYSQKLILGVVTACALVLLIFITSTIIESESGGIAAMVRIVGCCLAIWAAVRPKTGLYIVTFEAFSLDFVKKIAVYYGAVSTETIIQVLIVGMLAVVGTIGGLLVQGVALRAYKFRTPHWSVVIGAGLVTLAIFLSSYKTGGATKAAENAFNGGVYIALALPMMVLVADWDEIHKLLGRQFWLSVIWALWGIKQYYTGFTSLEWYYADTGLSEVASAHMYLFADPRPFGFGSGVSNYSILSAYLGYGIWRCRDNRADHFKYAVGSLILFWGVVTSMQRTMLLLPLLTLVFYFCFRTRGRTLFVYGSTVFVFITVVLASEKLFAYFNDINDTISLSGRWGESVLTVNTFSDRLYSYQNLLVPSTWSLFGTDSSAITHDFITRIVLSYGAAGLAASLLLAGTGCYFLHRTLLRIADNEEKNFAIFMIATIMPAIAVGLAGSGNIGTTPVNLQIWTFLGVAVTIIQHSEQKKPAAVLTSSVVYRPAGLAEAVQPNFSHRIDRGTAAQS